MIARIAFSVVAMASGAISQCTPDGTGSVDPAPQTHWIADYTGSFDANAGDTINQIMRDASDSSIVECENMGGTFRIHTNRVPICFDIDF